MSVASQEESRRFKYSSRFSSGLLESWSWSSSSFLIPTCWAGRAGLGQVCLSGSGLVGLALFQSWSSLGLVWPASLV